MANRRTDVPAPAEPRAAGAPKRARPQKTVFALKGVEEWGEWVRRLADHCGLPITNTIDVALLEHAKRSGFAEPMPKRQVR